MELVVHCAGDFSNPGIPLVPMLLSFLLVNPVCPTLVHSMNQTLAWALRYRGRVEG